jgi:hypothetical protein
VHQQIKRNCESLKIVKIGLPLFSNDNFGRKKPKWRKKEKLNLRLTNATSSSFAKRFAVVVAGRWQQAMKINRKL